MDSTPIAPGTRTVEAEIVYLAPGSCVNRRFVAPGVEHNTGRYEAHRVAIHDARTAPEPFSLDVQGFALAQHPSTIADFFDKDLVESVYPNEVVAIVKAMTGADRVVPMGWMIRTSGDLRRHAAPAVSGYTHKGGVQPPAAEAHVDFTPERAGVLARRLYEQAYPDGPGYSRFIASSLWRCFSAPPQDVPLALCDARSVLLSEGVPNTLFVVDRLPDPQAMLGPMPGEDDAMAAAIFRYNPAHHWWYFPHMHRDEVVLIKFHDSDGRRALRVPHTAFHDPSFAGARPRASIELRSVAFFD